MKKVAIVVFSRANYARIKTVIQSVAAHPDLELQLVVGASALLPQYGDIRSQLADQRVAIDWKIHAILEGGNPTTMTKSTGIAVTELATAWENLQPDIVLTVADRFETLATAISASYMNIPLAHTQGGEVTGSIDDKVRDAISQLADIHFPATVEAAQRLENQLNVPRETIHLTGCPAMDLLTNLPDPAPVNHLGKGAVIDLDQPYFVVMQHPVTTEYGQGGAQIQETLLAIEKRGIQTIWFTPNVDAGTDAISKRLRQFHEQSSAPVRFINNVPPEQYAALIARCQCLIGNSSSGLREAAFLGVAVVNIGSRQEGRERGKNVISVGYDHNEIAAAIEYQAGNTYQPDYRFGKGDAGERITAALAALNTHHK